MKTKFLLLFCAIFTSSIFASQAFAYTDVPANHEFAYEIEYLESLGLLPMDITKFEPDKEITPLDLYYLLLSYSQTELVNQRDIDLPYLDTDNNTWYSPYIQTAINKGLLKPAVFNPKLDPNRKVRKRETIMKTFDTLGIGVNKLFDETYFPFTDLDSQSTSAPYMFRAYQIGILESDPMLAKASKKMTRGEMAYILYQVYTSETGTDSGVYTIDLNYSTSEIDTPAFDIFLDVWETIIDSYYYQNEVDEEEMMYSAINGLIQTLDDPYTVFTSPFDSNPLVQLNTEYEGVGMSVEMIDNEVVIISPFKGSPAEDAGLEPNDVILEIGGKSVSGLSLDTVVNMIKGKAGSTVKIKIKRGSETKTITVTRGYITYNTVTLEYLEENEGDIAYVNMVSFSEDTAHEFLEIAQQIHDKQEEEGNVEGIILDLRNNPGGFLDVSIEIAGFFFDEDTNIVMLQENNGDKTMYYAEYYGTENEYEYGAGLLSDFDLVVLVNEGSASASEIVAGAIQDHDRGMILGEQTFGKGTVQEVFLYNDGSMFKLTISKWLTPKGQDINHEGLTPDRVLTNSETVDWQLDTAIEEILYN